MVTALDNKHEEIYVLRADRELEEDEQTKWTLRILTKREMTRVFDSLTVGESKRLKGADIKFNQKDAQTMWRVAASHIVGWENWNDENGEPVQFEQNAKAEFCFGVQRKMVKDDLLERLVIEHVMELAAACMGISDVLEEDVGN